LAQQEEKPLCSNVSPDTETELSTSGSSGRNFEIHVKGHLDDTWSKWLDGLEVKLLENGETILFGPIADQSALMGVLNKLVRLNLTLLSLNEVKK
jgi:hypothetical protein